MLFPDSWGIGKLLTRRPHNGAQQRLKDAVAVQDQVQVLNKEAGRKSGS